MDESHKHGVKSLVTRKSIPDRFMYVSYENRQNEMRSIEIKAEVTYREEGRRGTGRVPDGHITKWVICGIITRCSLSTFLHVGFTPLKKVKTTDKGVLTFTSTF